MLKSVEECLREISRKDEEIHSDSHYDEITSKVYDAYYRKLDWYNQNSNKIDKNIEDTDDKILCLACGPGTSIKYINENYNPSKIVGLDYSSYMINLAKERLSENNIELKQGDFTDLSSVNDSFDFIYMLGNPINHYKDSIMSF
jgi:ubiquinone/menaquinone biosynthesis C-methylase UbiE